MIIFKKPIIIWQSRLLRFLSKLTGAHWFGLTLYPFILMADPRSQLNYSRGTETDLAHESIHWKQIQEIGFVSFYWSYFKQYVSLRLKGLDHFEAYNLISFEILAYAKEERTDIPSDWIK